MHVRLMALLLLPSLGALICAASPRDPQPPLAGQQQVSVGAQPSPFERWYGAQPRVYMPVDANGAAVLIVKFSDYQCPPCAKSYDNDRPILARYDTQFPGAVRLVTKDFPLAPGCNPLVKQTIHAAACDAAVAVRLARRRNKSAEMEEWLFSHQPTLTPASVREAARSVAGVTDFDQAYPQMLAQVRTDVSLGQALGVQQTPTFFINGVRFNGEPAPQFLDMAIAYELKKAGRAPGPPKR